MRILITGVAGFGGRGLTQALVERGHEISGLDVIAPGELTWLETIDGRFTYHWKAVHDITPSDIEGHDAMVHLAAQADVPMGHHSSLWTCWQNVNATLHLLEAARHVELERFIYAGSGNEYGRPEYLPIDEDHPLTPHNPYSWSKAAAELACWSYHRAYGLPLIVMSNGVVVGPGMRREIFIYKWLRQALRGEPIVLQGGDQTRDVTYVGDVVHAWLAALEKPLDLVIGEKFQVSYGHELSVRELASICLDAAGRPDLPIIQAPYRPGEEGQRECFSNEKARRVLDYNPRVCPQEAIRHTLALGPDRARRPP